MQSGEKQSYELSALRASLISPQRREERKGLKTKKSFLCALCAFAVNNAASEKWKFLYFQAITTLTLMRKPIQTAYVTS